MGSDESTLPYDYCLIYKNSNQKSKYYLPLLLSRLYLTALFASSLSNHPFVLMIINTIISVIFVGYLLIIRPFNSAFTNVRVIIVEVLILSMNAVYGYYQFQAEKGEYVGVL